jgi:hypothetical protein
MKAAAGFIAVVLLWAAGNLFTGPLQHHFIFRFDSLPADHAFPFEQPFEEVVIPNGEAQIHGIYFVPDSAKGAVLYFHGNRGSVERWAAEVADEFLSRGYAVFIPDYRGYGKSRGPVSEEGFYEDANACYRWLSSRWIDSQIVVYGRSLGSAAACEVAAKASPRNLILETPFTSIEDLFYSYYPFLPGVFRFQFQLDNASRMPSIKAPVIIMAGSKDRTVPVSNTEGLRPLLKPGDRYEVVEGGRHNSLGSFPQYDALLDQVLR